MNLAGLLASGRDPLRTQVRPGTGEWRLSPSGLLAQRVAIGFKKAKANHVPNTRPADLMTNALFGFSTTQCIFHPDIERLNHAAAFERRGPR
jgi:hypothetical protein